MGRARAARCPTIWCAAAHILAAWLGLAPTAVAQESGLADRLRKFGDELAATAKADPGPLADVDLDLLEQAGLDAAGFAPRDLAGIVVMLRFDASLREADLPGVVEFGVGKDGGVVAFPLQVLFVLRGRIDEAGRLTTAALRHIPRAQRSYATWKRWETFFGTRDDFSKLSYDFRIALLRRFEVGDETEQQVVQDLLGKPGMTRELIPEVRKAVEVEWLELERMLQESRSPNHRTKVWLEDGSSLREVPTASLRRPDRFEVRLQADGDEPWGVLVLRDDSRPDDLLTKLAALRQLAATAGTDALDLREGRGPIAIQLREAVPGEVLTGIESVDEAVTHALATAELLRLRVTFELPRDAARDERAVATAKALLGAVRGGAKRLRELTRAGVRPTARDAGSDESALRVLRDVTAEASGWFRELAAAVPPVAADAGWRDMKVEHGGKVRTRVRIDPDSVHVVIVSDDPGTTHVQWCTLRPEELRGARFESEDGYLVVTPSRPFLTARVWPAQLGAGFNGFGIPCDSSEHRDALAEALRSFADGKPR